MSEISPVKWCKVGRPIGNIPKSRHGHRALAFNGKMIVFGGGSTTIQNKIHVYLPKINMWLRPKMFGNGAPYSCASHGFATDGHSRMFLFGGITASNKCTNNLYIIQSSYYVWEKIPSTYQEGPIPTPRMGHSFTYFENRIYLFGGLKDESDSENQYSNDLYVLDVLDNKFKWTIPKTSGSPPTPRESHTATIFIPKQQQSFPKLIIYGGMNGQRLGDVCILDIATMTWSKPNISSPENIFVAPRSQHTACLFNDKMYVFGGWTPVEDDDFTIKESIRSNSLAILDLNNMAWEYYFERKNDSKVPQPRTGHSAVILNFRLYIWSGRGDFPQIYKNQTCHDDLWYLELEKPKPPNKIEIVRVNRSTITIGWASILNADFYRVQIRDTKRNPKSSTAMKRIYSANSKTTAPNQNSETITIITKNFSDKSSMGGPLDTISIEIDNETKAIRIVKNLDHSPSDLTNAIRIPSNQTLNEDTSIQVASQPPRKVDDKTGSKSATPKKVTFSLPHTTFKFEDTPLIPSTTDNVVWGKHKKTPSSPAPLNVIYNNPLRLVKSYQDEKRKEKNAPPVLRSILKKRPKPTPITIKHTNNNEESNSETSNISNSDWWDVGVVRTSNCTIKHYIVRNVKNHPAYNFDSSQTKPSSKNKKGLAVPLEPNTEYQIRLCSINKLGMGPWSNVLTVRTCDDAHPLPPKDVRIINTESLLRLCWSGDEHCKESSDNEQENTEYIVKLAVKKDHLDGENASDKNDDIEGTKTNESEPSTPYSFALIYEGRSESIPLCESYLKQAYIDRTQPSRPAVLFQICARNSKGRSRTIQIKWNYRESFNKKTFSLKRPSPISFDVIKKLRTIKRKPILLKKTLKK